MASARGTRVDLAWIDASNDESSFEVLRRAVGGSFALVATVPANNTTHIDQATAGTQFEYVVRACNAAGCSGNSTSAMAVTVPITPPNVGINLETDFTVTLSWDNVAHETLYRIDRDDFGDGQWYSGGGTDADVTVWASDPEDFYAPYASYRVMACNDAGCSPPSPPVFADIGEGSSPRSPFKKTANGAGRGGSR
jgi:titin